MRMPGRAPKAELEYEAKAEGLTLRGDVYRLNDLLFPPGEWVPVPPYAAECLRLTSWAEVREREG